MAIQQTQPNTQPTVYASVGERISMFLLDSLIIALLVFLIRGFLTTFLSSYYNEFNNETGALLRDALSFPYLIIAVGVAYHFVMEQSFLQGSFGKRFLGYKVYAVNDTPLSWKNSMLRNCIKGLILFGPMLFENYFDELTPVISIAVVVFALIILGNNSKNRSLNDLWAGTFVAK
jgi:uncharacterized RDD family membrane protein YckC